MESTEEERKWFARLKRCFNNMPDSAWIFVANDIVNMMRRGEHGGQVRTPLVSGGANVGSGGEVNQDNLLGSFAARIDGGDW